jgi:hypothetical protein
MGFEFYTNLLSRATRNFAAGMFIVGMLLVGFGFLIWVLKELFAMLFATLFCIVGISCGVTAVKMFWAIHRIEKGQGNFEGTAGESSEQGEYRKSVEIHVRQPDED